jgi:anti-sigma regulatory factor (Ser/Thr protein kinase)
MTWKLQLPADATAPGIARQAVSRWLRDCRRTVRNDAQSVVSELVTRALKHGAPPIELSISTRDGRARIEVSDSRADKRRRPRDRWSQRIVAGLARWGVHGDQAHVWFEVPLSVGSAAVPSRQTGERRGRRNRKTSDPS